LRTLVFAVVLVCGALLYEKFQPKQRQGRFENVVVVRGLDTPFAESSPTPSADDLELYFGSNRPGGKGSHDIWVVTRPNTRTPWGEPRNVEELNTPAQEEPGWLSEDGLRLYYARAEKRKKPKDILLAKRSRRDSTARWERVLSDELQSINTAEYSEGMPSLTTDECEMYFHSDRPGGAGGRDIWVATRSNPLSPWNAPRNLKEINGPGHGRQPCISSDGLTLWWTKAEAGEIWQASRESKESPFGTARLVEPPVNSYAWEGHFEVSASWPEPGSPAYFSRVRPNAEGRFQGATHRVTWNPAATSFRHLSDTGASDKKEDSD
jgi:hypothetical protein